MPLEVRRAARGGRLPRPPLPFVTALVLPAWRTLTNGPQPLPPRHHLAIPRAQETAWDLLIIAAIAQRQNGDLTWLEPYWPAITSWCVAWPWP